MFSEVVGTRWDSSPPTKSSFVKFFVQEWGHQECAQSPKSLLSCEAALRLVDWDRVSEKRPSPHQHTPLDYCMEFVCGQPQ